MFSTTRQKLLLAVFVILVISIPISSYLLSERQTLSSKADEKIDRSITSLEPLKDVVPDVIPKDELKNLIEQTPPSVTYGPTLNFKAIIEGRPINKQATKMFVGVAEGTPVGTPKYLLQFTVDLPDSGVYNGLSLAGLTPNNQYTAYLKGPAQIATSSAFLMVPTTTTLNSGNPLTLLTGDLNEDNIVNSADFTIAKSIFGATSTSSNWNGNADFNLDGIINMLDLSLILKNIDKSGESGVWVSPVPKGLATPSATGGYWLWLPQI